MLQARNLLGGRGEAPPAYAGAATGVRPATTMTMVAVTTADTAARVHPAAAAATGMASPAAMSMMVAVAVTMSVTVTHLTHVTFLL